MLLLQADGLAAPPLSLARTHTVEETDAISHQVISEAGDYPDPVSRSFPAAALPLDEDVA